MKRLPTYCWIPTTRPYSHMSPATRHPGEGKAPGPVQSSDQRSRGQGRGGDGQVCTGRDYRGRLRDSRDGRGTALQNTALVGT